MAQKKRYIQLSEIEPGMRLAESINDDFGHHMIEQGVFLDDFYINYLQNNGVSGIFVVSGDLNQDEYADIKLTDTVKQVIEDNLEEDPPVVQLREEVKKRIGEGVQYLFDNSDSDQFVEVTHSISKDLLHAISSNNALAFDINMLKCSDEYTFKHSVDVATMAMIIAKEHGMDNKSIHEIGIAGLLHDMGKANIPLEVLNKNGQLTDDEFRIMKQHPVFGYQILKEKNVFSDSILNGVLEHHEKCNGRGYPLGLQGDKIHDYAKIISVADIYDALVTDRPYKQAFSRRTAMEMILATSADLDLPVLYSFINSIILFPVDSIVELSNGEKAKVVKNNKGYPMRPDVVGLTTGTLYHLADDINCANVIIY